MAPRRSSPLTVHFAKTPFLNLFFSSGGPNFKSRDGADLDAARVPAGRTWARVPRRPDLGSRSGAGLAPPPAGRGRSSSREPVPPGEEERPSSPAGRPPPQAAPSPTLAAPPLSGAPSGRAGAPLAVEGLRLERKGRPPAPTSSAGRRIAILFSVTRNFRYGVPHKDTLLPPPPPIPIACFPSYCNNKLFL
jgi:hypothetical protein